MPRTSFRPETDGYLFANEWTYDDTEIATLTTIATEAVAAIEVIMFPIIGAALGPADT